MDLYTVSEEKISLPTVNEVERDAAIAEFMAHFNSVDLPLEDSNLHGSIQELISPVSPSAIEMKLKSGSEPTSVADLHAMMAGN